MHEITSPGALLDKKGRLREPGFAKSLILDYDRKAIKAAGFRIKEWDYYLVTNDHFAVALTIADNSYMGLDSISLLNFDEKWEITCSPMRWFTNGKTGLPSTTAKGNVQISGKGYQIDFVNEGSRRVLHFTMDKFAGKGPIAGEIVLSCPQTDSMVIATPFPNDKKAFYYNQKINCMPASGRVSFGGKEYVFDQTESFGVRDWGRGVWTYKNTWYWGSASGLVDGVPFGFNIGYGFGDTSAASENMLFYDNKGHKLSQVRFNIPQKKGKDDFLSPWTFSSDDGRFQMNFEPILDRKSKTDVGIICSDQHQVFGRFSGEAVLDDGRVITIKDFTGFAEKVFNKW